MYSLDCPRLWFAIISGDGKLLSYEGKLNIHELGRTVTGSGANGGQAPSAMHEGEQNLIQLIQKFKNLLLLGGGRISVSYPRGRGP
jgi:hypothetical protein